MGTNLKSFAYHLKLESDLESCESHWLNALQSRKKCAGSAKWLPMFLNFENCLVRTSRGTNTSIICELPFKSYMHNNTTTQQYDSIPTQQHNNTTAQQHAMQRIATQRNATQRNAMQCNAMQCSACDAISYNLKSCGHH